MYMHIDLTYPYNTHSHFSMHHAYPALYYSPLNEFHREREKKRKEKPTKNNYAYPLRPLQNPSRDLHKPPFQLSCRASC